MKTKGKLTSIGKDGIIFGLFIIIMRFYSMVRDGFHFEIKELFSPIPLIGVALIIVSFLWARKPVGK